MHLTRDDLIAVLFRETDRAQRMKTPLAVIVCEIVDCPQLRSKLGETALGSALEAIEKRIVKLLRCYDSLGQIAEGKLVLVLPGCNRRNAVTMAERLNHEVFAFPEMIGDQEIRFEACFGVASTGGRSPFAVLNEAECALLLSKSQGPGAVRCNASSTEADPDEFVITVMQDFARTLEKAC